MSVTISERKNELSNKELLGIKGFLKQLANEYSDMELLMRGITDPQKAADAKTIAKDFRKKIRECDDAVGDGNLDKVIELYPTTAKQLTDFLLLLQDVPDEL